MPRANRKLTELEIRKAKPKDKDYKLYDEGGLRLLVRASGTKVWQYPYTFAGKSNIFTIGKHEAEITTAEARQKRDEVRRLVKEGVDPNGQKKATKIKIEYEHRNSFEEIAREWMSKQHWAPKYAASTLSRLEKDIFPVIGRKPITQVTRQDILYALQSIEKRGALEMTARMNQCCSRIFDYALIKGICDNNPAVGLSKAFKAHKAENRAYLRENQLPEFLEKLETYPGSELVKLAMKLLMLTFVRPGELRGARWDEINEEKAEWRIPAERMKMRREHIVPLSTQALEVIRKIHKVSHYSDLLFPGVKSKDIPISDVTLTKLLVILGYRGMATAHGMRATASTILNEHGFRPDVIERQLAHIEQNKIRAAYHHAEYLKERKEMMQWWGDYLQRLAPKK